MTTHAVDLDRLLKLRVLVARFGEMDLAKWWNTRGQLGSHGATALKRGFPRTHYFAQARSAFAVANHRCAEIFNPPGSATLWQLPEAIEEEFDSRWEQWLDAANKWTEFFVRIAVLPGRNLTNELREHDLVEDRDLERFTKLRRAAEGHSVPLPGAFRATNDDIALLALGFGRGEIGALAVPHMSLR